MGQSIYYYREGSHAVGPFSKEKLVELYSKGIINSKTMVKLSNSDYWIEYDKFNAEMRIEPTVNFETTSKSEQIIHSVKETIATQLSNTSDDYQDNLDKNNQDIQQHQISSVRFTNSVNENSYWVSTPVAPWRRYFARLFDVTAFGVIGFFLIGFVAYTLVPLEADAFFKDLNPILDIILTAFVGFVISGLVLGFVGTTFGKAIFGIRVRDLNGNPIGLMNGLTRDMSAYLRGFGLGIPVVSLITMIMACSKLTKLGTTAWDKDKYIITYRKGSWKQTVLNLIGFIIYFLLIALVKILDKM